MVSRRIDDISTLCWDDSVLIKAYNKGMSLEVKEFEEENSKEKNKNSKKNKWRTGDFCRAVYPHDNMEYEAKIVDLNGKMCIVDFLGYNEEVEVEVDTLSKSHGNQSRRKQIRKARYYVSTKESMSGDNSKYSNDTNSCQRQRHMSHNRVVDTSANYTAAENNFHHVVNPVPTPHCTNLSSATAMAPPLPPLPPMSDMGQNHPLSAMLSSWYMAGYYTGLHQKESMSGDDSKYSDDTNSRQHQRHMSHNYVVDKSANYTAAENNFHHVVNPVPTPHCTNLSTATVTEKVIPSLS